MEGAVSYTVQPLIFRNRNMKYTNEHGLPPIVEGFLKHDTYRKHPTAWASASSLAKPQWQRFLASKFDDHHTVERDCTDMLPMRIGTGLHSEIEAYIKAEWPTAEPEIALEGEILGKLISGTADLYVPEEQALYDWKTANVWTDIFLLEGEYNRPGKTFYEYNLQLNIYAHLLEMMGKPVKHIFLCFFFTNWEKKKSFNEDYPNGRAKVYSLELMDKAELERELQARINEYEVYQAEAELCSSSEDIRMLGSCSSGEMWEKPAQHAIMKKGRKSALRVLSSQKEAYDYAISKGYLEVIPGIDTEIPGQPDSEDWRGGHYYEYRPGVRTKCEDHCAYNRVCGAHQGYLYSKSGKVERWYLDRKATALKELIDNEDTILY